MRPGAACLLIAQAGDAVSAREAVAALGAMRALGLTPTAISYNSVRAEPPSPEAVWGACPAYTSCSPTQASRGTHTATGVDE